MRSVITTAVLALLVGAGGVAAQEMTATATLINPEGDEIGQAELIETPNEGVLIKVQVEGLAPGAHGFHIHETGECTAPDFSSAGGHYAPRGHAHGVLHPDGKHAGDLLNLVVPESGTVDTERLAPGVTLMADAEGSLFDDDGSALVIHANADDYESQPAGGGGPKVACGVIRQR
ncbi:MAG: superoxide dismutase family protein [Candidatus Longimicrobiales bacterium M2_2A_002]